MFFWVKLGNVSCDSFFNNQMVISFNINDSTGFIFIAKPKLRLINFLIGKENLLLHKKVSSYKVYSAV